MTEPTIVETARPAAVDEPIDATSWELRALATLEATLITRIEEDIAHYEAAGRKVMKQDLRELLAIRDNLARRVARQELAEQLWAALLFAAKRIRAAATFLYGKLAGACARLLTSEKRS